MGLENVDYVVVVMMENRSFDNLLGWLYSDVGNRPPLNIPAQDPTTFEGLSEEKYWNCLQAPNSPKVYASRPPTVWPNVMHYQVPTPDPHEEFEFVTQQLFGDVPPASGTVPGMSGFLHNYSTTEAATAAGQIMQTYGPEEANVINELARNFAVCDHWFASVPTQTWPNRAFVHAGSSDGHINNDHYVPYDIPTIFNVLEREGHSWGIFSDTITLPALAQMQFIPLWNRNESVHNLAEFKRRCAGRPDDGAFDKLPKYSFVEPCMMAEPQGVGIKYPADYHPPHNVCRGEQFLAEVYGTIRASPYRDRILLVITFDEHGGCYDHVPPPWGAAAPQPSPVSRDGAFHFDRFGVRVPAIVVSSYVVPGTVFRAEPEKTPYDHTSILATLRDWMNLGGAAQGFLPSPRIQAAPTLDRVLTLSEAQKNTNWPEITAKCSVGEDDTSLSTPLSDVQKSIMAHTIRVDSFMPDQRTGLATNVAGMDTYQDAIDYLNHRLPSFIVPETGNDGNAPSMDR